MRIFITTFEQNLNLSLKSFALKVYISLLFKICTRLTVVEGGSTKGCCNSPLKTFIMNCAH